MLTPLKSSSLVLVMISSMSVSICNCLHSKRANSGKITTFWEVAVFDSRFLEPRGPGLRLLKYAFNDENFVYRLSCQSLAISVQFTFKMCAAGGNHEKFTKTLLFGVEGHAMSSMLINLKSQSPVLAMICSMSILICNRFHTRRANSGKITFLGVPFFDTLFRGEPSHPGTQSFVTKKLESLKQRTVKIS